MTRSMTGYGRKVLQDEKEQIVIEIRTVNHRFLDISTHMPNELLYLETTIKNVMKSYMERGSVDIYIHIDDQKETPKTVRTNWQLMDQYVNEINKAKNRYDIDEAVPLSLLFQLPDLINMEEETLNPDKWETAILNGLHEAAGQVSDMRQSEGEHLQSDILRQLDDVRETVRLLRTNRNDVIRAYQTRIQMRVKAYVDDVSIDDGRLQQEIAILAEKGDISEELTRIESHVEHFADTIQSEGQAGRTLDFIIQEMHREMNTIASKSQDAKMNQRIIHTKRNIEKIKEQIQNIE